MEKLNLVGSAEKDGMRVEEVEVVEEGLWEEGAGVGGSRGEVNPSIAEAEWSIVLEEAVTAFALPLVAPEGDDILTL